jgi:hypothetical protein
MSLIGMELNRNIFNQNAEIASLYFSLKLALLSAAHAQSIGNSLTSGWVYESYKNRYDNETVNQIVFNDYVGRTVGINTQNNGFYLFLDVTVSSWINGNRAVPGVTRVGTFNGVPLYANPFASGSFSLPASTRGECGIYLQSASLDDGDAIKHEFGHILQGEDLGLWCFYTEIAINSPKSAKRDGQNGYSHKCYYTETDANSRSKTYHLFTYPDFQWNDDRYPIASLCPGYEPRTPCSN